MVLASLLLAVALLADPAPSRARTVVYDRPEMKTRWPDIAVGSGSFPIGGSIPMQHSGYGKNLAPSLRWTAGPDGTVSYVVVVEDPDAGEVRPLLHWLAYGIAADVRELPAKTKNVPRVDDDPLVFSQAVNDHGGIGWTGPHPPVGDPPHHYHFQVFALDYTVQPPPGTTFDVMVKQMAGHVLAKGQIVATYEQRPDPVRKPRKIKGSSEAVASAP